MTIGILFMQQIQTNLHIDSSVKSSFDGPGFFGCCILGQSGQRNKRQARMATTDALLNLIAPNMRAVVSCPNLTCTRRSASFSSPGSEFHFVSLATSFVSLLASSSSATSSSGAALPYAMTQSCLPSATKGLNWKMGKADATLPTGG
jgi:hypothetical protein